MLHAGEDPRFISRRLVIAASEDIGLADSNALRVALDAHHALEFVGMPEGRIPLAHATVYLATAPKSNTAYAALGRRWRMWKRPHARRAAAPAHQDPQETRRRLGRSEESMKYLYSHDFEGAYVPQAYLPRRPDLLSTRRPGHGKAHQGTPRLLAFSGSQGFSCEGFRRGG
jgi:putative ATPase